MAPVHRRTIQAPTQRQQHRQPGCQQGGRGRIAAAGCQPRGRILLRLGQRAAAANYAAIMSFLTAHGYTGNAAAGIAGNIYQESGGNPESGGDGGGGLIGWTPLPAGYVTGNPPADLQTQLAASWPFTTSGRRTSRR